MSAVLKFPSPSPSIEEDDNGLSGGEGSNYVFRLACPSDGCGSRFFHIQMEIDPDNGRVDTTWYTCANCGDQILLPDGIDPKTEC